MQSFRILITLFFLFIPSMIHAQDVCYPVKKAVQMEDPQYPPNMRRITEGYMLGGLPDNSTIDSLQDCGIKVILSLTDLDYKTTKRLDTLDIDQVYMGINHKFYRSNKIDYLMEAYNPEDIYIHCKHGSDRTGVVTAYILIKYHGWNTVNALLSVLSKNNVDLRGLLRIFDTYGIPYTQEQIDLFWGINAPINGGLKTHNEDYVDLISTMLDTISMC